MAARATTITPRLARGSRPRRWRRPRPAAADEDRVRRIGSSASTSGPRRAPRGRGTCCGCRVAPGCVRSGRRRRRRRRRPRRSGRIRWRPSRCRSRCPRPDRRRRAEPGQHERAYLGLGHHRIAVLEGVLGERPAVPEPAGRGTPSRAEAGRESSRHEHDVRIGPLRVGRLVGRAGGHDAFIAVPSRSRRRTIGRGARAAAGAELAGPAPGAGQHGDLREGAAGVRRAPQPVAAAVGADHQRVVPVTGRAGAERSATETGGGTDLVGQAHARATAG